MLLSDYNIDNVYQFEMGVSLTSYFIIGTESSCTTFSWEIVGKKVFLMDNFLVGDIFLKFEISAFYVIWFV